MNRFSLGLAISLLISSPAYARTAVALPDPNALTLLSLGLAGLLIGRRAARKRRDDE